MSIYHTLLLRCNGRRELIEVSQSGRDLFFQPIRQCVRNELTRCLYRAPIVADNLRDDLIELQRRIRVTLHDQIDGLFQRER